MQLYVKKNVCSYILNQKYFKSKNEKILFQPLLIGTTEKLQNP